MLEREKERERERERENKKCRGRGDRRAVANPVLDAMRHNVRESRTDYNFLMRTGNKRRSYDL